MESRAPQDAADNATIHLGADHPERWRPAIDQLRSPEGWLYASSPRERFGSLFGRDSLISALALLPIDPTIADKTLHRLGTELAMADDPATEAEPGKVLHEGRDHDLDAYIEHGWPVQHGRLRYYGSIDASLWFLILFAALARFGHPVAGHRGAARRVVQWLEEQPIPLSYRWRNGRAGLAHHWWRDVAVDLQGNGHGMLDVTGRPMKDPVGVAAVAALAWRAWADIADTLDRHADIHAQRARDIFFSTFQSSDAHAGFAMTPHGLDAAPTSDLGIIGWTGIATGSPREANAQRLLTDDLLTPYGIRTLPTSHNGFSPDGYHTGTVWPFDNWFSAAALETAGFAEAARGVRGGIVQALDRIGSYPELFVVDPDTSELRRSEESCDLQAWTVATVAATAVSWDGRSWS